MSGVDREVPRRWVLAVASWFLAVPLDPLGVLYERNAIGLVRSLAVLVVPLVAWSFLRFFHFRRGPFKRWASRAPRTPTFVMLLTMGLALAYCRTALISRGSITYWYGDRAFAEARIAVQEWLHGNNDGQVYVPAKDLAYATREFGTIYLPMGELGEKAAALCAGPKPILIVTRAREDSSLMKSYSLQDYRGCLEIRQGVDIALGSAYSRW